ncbi:hybrid sensor histidine kinase/response regulator transcription factor [Gelidibacter pelagius]|uniref:histidine kinase n=1 Tax=Gelidibacter pelagius TaxID=2819985 RepID=A0ABS3STX6_9FLAO|nr:hybrid sensor histidine kinase/response regulator transcription factor [Gelidibacter pelagius]MBO3099159.1 response regulator [Gelidibacter pelagius]
MDKTSKNIQINKNILCCMMYVFGMAQLFGQSQVSFRQLSVHDGLSQNSVVSVTQDSIGYLWLATQDGLNKYDGHQFEIFNEFFVDITRPDYSYLGQIYTDRDGNIITIPISKNPQIYNKKENRFTSFSNLQDVSTVFQDRKKNYWFGTYASGVFKKDFTSGRMVSVLSSYQIKTIFSIAEDPQGTLWITSQGKIISIDQDGAIQNYFPDGDTDSKVNYSKLIADGLDGIWLGTYGNGLWHKDGESSDFKRINALNEDDFELPDNLNILSMHLDKKNRLWVGTFGNGLFKLNLNSSQIKHFEVKKQDPRAIRHNDILCIFEDYTGTLWFGTDGAGISFYDEYLEKFNFINNNQTPEGIHIDLVRAIHVDKNKKVWIGTSGKGLSAYSPQTNQWKTYVRSKNGLSSNRIVSLFTDDVEDELWIGTQEGGLNILQANGRITHYNHTTSIALPAQTIWSILKDEAQNIWLSTRDNGLIQFDKYKGVLKIIDASKGLMSNNIRITIPGEKDKLWIGTEEDGVFSFNTKTEVITDVLKDFQVEDKSLFKKIKSLYYDNKGLLWVGTNGDGLVVFDIKNGEYYQYTMEDGLPNNVIYAILPDSENNLWLSSNRGITMIEPPENLKHKPVIVNYNNYDGLATEFNTGAYFKAKNNSLYFGGLEGFYWFNPAEIQENKVIPKTVLTNFEVFNRSLPLTNDTILNYKQNTLSFTFSSLQFSLPKKNNYRYKLENYDQDWIDSKFTNKVRYTNLASGNYQFLVKSSNYDGVWNDVPESLSFVISKPWYLSNWMLFAYIFLSMVLAFLTYYYFKWRWKMQLDLKQEKEESVRLKRLDEYKTKLYTNLAHEFRSPLTLITAPIKKQLLRNDLKSEAKNDLKLVERNTNQLLNLVDQLLELSKLESGKLRLKVKQHDLGLYLKVITESFQFLAEQHGLKLKASIPEIENAWFDADIVEKIVNNLFSNAIKYTSKGGEIYLHVKEDHLGRCKMTFINDIDGIVEQNISKIFNRFHQINEDSEGSGIGLSLVKELATLAHGTIEASYLGTTKMKFVINLPIRKEAFSENEIDYTVPFQTIESHLEITPKNKQPNTKPIALVVDDNQDIRNFIKSLLTADFRVIKAKNGSEGIEKAFKHIPDIIISDVVMPIKTGFELCKTLKQDDRTSHIPIIMLTGKTDETNEIIGLATGADDYITKPFNPRTFQIKIHNIIENRKKLHKRYQQDNLFRPQEIAVTSADEVFLKKVQKILDQNLSDPEFNADTFSKQVGMSRMQLHRKMLAYTGLSTSNFIRSQRLKQATLILQASEYSINEVAYMVGFNTPSYFIKCFKKLYGETPNEYLKK